MERLAAAEAELEQTRGDVAEFCAQILKLKDDLDQAPLAAPRPHAGAPRHALPRAASDLDQAPLSNPHQAALATPRPHTDTPIHPLPQTWAGLPSARAWMRART